MAEIKDETRQQDKYTIKMTYLPGGHVQSITIWKYEMGSGELGDLVKELDQEYQPLKIIIVNDNAKTKLETAVNVNAKSGGGALMTELKALTQAVMALATEVHEGRR